MKLRLKDKINLVCLITFYICSLSAVLTAQPVNASFRNLTSADGLPTTSVTDVTQDSFGLIWIGSWDGVYRYDGKSFQTIYSGDARLVKADDKGGVWISTEGGKLGYYNSYTDSIKFYKVRHPERFIPIRIDNSGTVWAGTLNGIAKLDTVKDQFKKDKGQQPRSFISDYFCASGNGELYFLMRKNNGNYALGHRDLQGKYSYESFPMDKNNPGKEFFPSDYIELLPFDSTGLLIVNQYGWAYKTSSTAKWIFKKPFSGKKLSGFSSATLDRNNNLWLNQENAISKINISTGKAVTYKNNPQNPNSILPMGNFFGSKIFIDKQGVLWATRFTSGISRLNLYESDFGLLRYKNGSPVIDVLSALELKDGSFWIGSRVEHNGLIHFSSGGKIIKRYGTTSFNSLPGKSLSKELSHPFAWSIARTSDGSIWVGTGSPGPEHGGLNRIRPGSNLIERFKYDPHDKSSLSNNWDYKLLVDGSDRLWIGSEGALCYMDPATEKITRGLKSSSSDSVDNTPYEPELVTSSGNLIIINPYNYKHFIINHKTLEKKSFGIKTSSDSLLNYVFQDEKGRIWFIDGKKFGHLNSSFTHIAQIYNIEKSNIPVDKIDALCVDKNGNIWLATSNGIIQFYPDTQKFRHFGYERGLQGVNFSADLDYEGSSGKIYFSGYGGVNIFDPLKIKTNPFPPEMVFTGLKLDGKLIRFGKNSPIKKPIYAASKVIVEPGVSTISINFAAIHFADAKYNHYKYKLEGFDDNWKDGGSIGNATYTNLPPGIYTLYIKGANLDGVWSNGKKSIEIDVLPPWWQTWWAYTLYIALGLTILFLIRKFELNRKLKNARLRESQLRLEASEAKAKVIEAENARKTEELEEARKLQLSMLPKEIPHLPHLDIAVYMQTATEVGGDYYDFYTGTDGVLTVALGDATGHGLKAGTMVTAAKSLFSSYGKNDDIVKTFYEMSRTIKSMNLPLLTMCLTILKIKDHTITLSSAGMPPVMIFRKDKMLVEEVALTGMPLGAVKDFPYKKTDLQLNGGDTILMMSDGFPELKNEKHELLGYERVKEYLSHTDGRSPEELIEMLKEHGKDWRNGSEITDDITFIAIKIK